MFTALAIEPDPDDADCAVLWIDGHVGGRPARFVLDSGAARSRVVTSGDPILAATGTASGVFGQAHTVRVVIPEIRVGEVTAKRLEVDVVMPPNAQPNLLGVDFLGSHSLLLDLDRSLVGIDEQPPEGLAWQALRRGERGHPQLPLNWHEVSACAVWDSGAGMTIASQSFVTAHPHLFTPAGVTTGTDANGRRLQTSTYTMAPYHLGGTHFRPHRIAVIDLVEIGADDIDIILGYTAIDQANWYIDFPEQRWACWPRSTVSS